MAPTPDNPGKQYGMSWKHFQADTLNMALFEFQELSFSSAFNLAGATAFPGSSWQKTGNVEKHGQIMRNLNQNISGFSNSNGEN